jgi:hypothetical protein
LWAWLSGQFDHIHISGPGGVGSTGLRGLDAPGGTASQSSTTLAHGPINGADTLTIELIQPDNHPPVVRIVWPAAPTIVDPKRFPDTAATVAQLFARAHIVLAALKAHGR